MKIFLKWSFILFNFFILFCSALSFAKSPGIEGLDEAKILMNQQYLPKLTWEELDSISDSNGNCFMPVVFFYKNGNAFTGDLPDKVVLFSTSNDNKCNTLKRVLGAFVTAADGRGRPSDSFEIINDPCQLRVSTMVDGYDYLVVVAFKSKTIWYSESGTVPQIEGRAREMNSRFNLACSHGKQIKLYSDKRLDTPMPELVLNRTLSSTKEYVTIPPCFTVFDIFSENGLNAPELRLQLKNRITKKVLWESIKIPWDLATKAMIYSNGQTMTACHSHKTLQFENIKTISAPNSLEFESVD
ncbi:MAG: hypothetical protein ACXVCP_13995 [Bdellovibrio sp.]